MLKVRYALAGAVLLALGAAFQPASAQGFTEDRVRPVEILNFLYDNGYSRVRRPVLRGDVYVIVATDARGMRVRLVIDAFDGYLVNRNILGRDPVFARNERRRGDGRLAEESVSPGPDVPDSSVTIDDRPKAKPKPKPKRPKVAALPPPDEGKLSAPGAATPKAVPPVEPEPQAARPPVKPVEPPKQQAKAPATAPDRAAPEPLRPVGPQKTVPPRLVAPENKPVVAEAPATPVSRPRPRVIPITPPAELDAPKLPAPPPLRTGPPVPPVVGLE